MKPEVHSAWTVNAGLNDTRILQRRRRATRATQFPAFVRLRRGKPAPSRLHLISARQAGRHIPRLTALRFANCARPSRQRVLECGGKRSATPLSHARDVLIVPSSSPARKHRRRSRLRFASARQSRSARALHDASASVEPSIDYVATKIPRFAFEKFPQAGVAAFGRKPPSENPRSVCGALPSRRYG